MKLVCMVIFGISATVCVAQAGPSPFSGHWKLDPARSSYAGDTVTYTKTPTGYTYTSGGLSYSFATDGKDYPELPGWSSAWTAVGPGAWDDVEKANGKIATEFHRTLSPDGKRMKSVYVIHHPDGSTSPGENDLDRLSGAGGLAGVWKISRSTVAVAVMDIAISDSGVFRIEERAEQLVITGRADGSPVTVTGPTVPAGASEVYHMLSPASWEYTFFVDRKPLTKSIVVVSPDGQSMTQTSWAPGKEDEKDVEVFQKQ